MSWGWAREGKSRGSDFRLCGLHPSVKSAELSLVAHACNLALRRMRQKDQNQGHPVSKQQQTSPTWGPYLGADVGLVGIEGPTCKRKMKNTSVNTPAAALNPQLEPWFYFLNLFFLIASLYFLCSHRPGPIKRTIVPVI